MIGEEGRAPDGRQDWGEVAGTYSSLFKFRNEEPNQLHWIALALIGIGAELAALNNRAAEYRGRK